MLEADDIEEIVGIGPVIGAQLREQGITTFAQIAAWTAPRTSTRIGDEIDFPGRVEREHWIDQARELQARKYGEPDDFPERNDKQGTHSHDHDGNGPARTAGSSASPAP